MHADTAFGYYRFTCYLAALINAFSGIFAFFFFFRFPELYRDFPESSQATLPLWYLQLVCVVTGVVCIFFTAANIYLPSAPRTQKWWTAHLINLILMAGGCCTTIPAVIALINWFRPDVRGMFGFEPPRPPEGAQRP
jgi:hypothetical protein